MTTLRTPLGVTVRTVPPPEGISGSVVELSLSVAQLRVIFPRIIKVPGLPVRRETVVGILIADVLADVADNLVAAVRSNHTTVNVQLMVGLQEWERTYLAQVSAALREVPGVHKVTFWLK